MQQIVFKMWEKDIEAFQKVKERCLFYTESHVDVYWSRISVVDALMLSVKLYSIKGLQ